MCKKERDGKEEKAIHHKNVNLSLSLTRKKLKHFGVKPPLPREDEKETHTKFTEFIFQVEWAKGWEENVVWLNSHWMINDLQIGLWWRLLHMNISTLDNFFSCKICLFPDFFFPHSNSLQNFNRPSFHSSCLSLSHSLLLCVCFWSSWTENLNCFALFQKKLRQIHLPFPLSFLLSHCANAFQHHFNKVFIANLRLLRFIAS